MFVSVVLLGGQIAQPGLMCTDRAVRDADESSDRTIRQPWALSEQSLDRSALLGGRQRLRRDGGVDQRQFVCMRAQDDSCRRMDRDRDEIKPGAQPTVSFVPVPPIGKHIAPASVGHNDERRKRVHPPGAGARRLLARVTNHLGEQLDALFVERFARPRDRVERNARQGNRDGRYRAHRSSFAVRPSARSSTVLKLVR